MPVKPPKKVVSKSKPKTKPKGKPTVKAVAKPVANKKPKIKENRYKKYNFLLYSNQQNTDEIENNA